MPLIYCPSAYDSSTLLHSCLYIYNSPVAWWSLKGRHSALLVANPAPRTLALLHKVAEIIRYWIFQRLLQSLILSYSSRIIINILTIEITQETVLFNTGTGKKAWSQYHLTEIGNSVGFSFHTQQKAVATDNLILTKLSYIQKSLGCVKGAIKLNIIILTHGGFREAHTINLSKLFMNWILNGVTFCFRMYENGNKWV